MNDFAPLKIASDGMSAQRLRMKLIAENLANQHTTGPDGPYQRKEAVFQSVPVASFAGELDSALREALTPEEIDFLHTVTVSEVRPDGAPPILRYEPQHPQADANGYVAYPNVNVMREMTDMIEANRTYEANLAVMKTTTDMLRRASELLG